MRTVSQLSKLTGMDRRTIQYFATEKLPGKSSEGAGIITPCHINENGYRYFDDDALLELLAIKTLRQCGYEPKAIRHIMHDNDPDPVSVADLQIKALEKAKREIDQQIQFVNLLKVVFTIDCLDEKALAAILSLFIKLFIASVEQVIRKRDPNYVFDMEDEDIAKAMRDPENASKAAFFEASMKVMEHVGKGDMDLAIELLPPEMQQVLSNDDEVEEGVIVKCIKTLAELFKAGKSPKSKDACCQAAILFREISPKRTFGNLNVITQATHELMEGTYIAILAELFVGEGFADYVAKAFEAYYAMAEKQVEKEIAKMRIAEERNRATD